jgi:hypothetical protein
MVRLKTTLQPLSLRTLAWLAVLVFALFVFRAMASTGGHRAAPLDDTFIHLQYASQIADGHYYRYQAGEPPTTGATSWLYVHLLALPALVFKGKNLLTAAAVMNLCFFTFTLYYLGRLAKSLYGKEAGFAAPVLALSSGALLWGVFSQMEIALFCFLIVLTAWKYRCYLTGKGTAGSLMAGATLLALVRPEGAIMAMILAATLAFQQWRRREESKESMPIRWKILLLPFAAYLAEGLFNWLLTGETASAGLLAKSEFSPAKPFLISNLQAAVSNLGEVLLFLLGFQEQGRESFVYLPPAALILFLAGTAWAIGKRSRFSWLQSIHPWMLASVLAVSAAVATLFCFSVHHWRYLLPLFPLLWLGIAGGIVQVASVFKRRGKAVFVLLFALLLASNASQWLFWVNTFGRECGIHYHKHFRLARWIRHHLPRDGRIAINDAGLLPYYSRRASFDLVGLTTRGAALPFRTGYGALAEFLESLPEEERFDYYCVFPGWFPSFSTQGFFGEELYRINDPYSDPLHEKKVFRANWDWAGSGDRARLPENWPGWTLCDRLDVADLASEADHDYEPIPDPERRVPADLHARMAYRQADCDQLEWTCFDGGREIRGGERFTLEGLDPGRPARLAMRTGNPLGGEGFYQSRVRVFIDGASAGEWLLNPQPWRWKEEVFDIPAERITGSRLEIEIYFESSAAEPFYGSYHYWIYQPESTSGES